MSSSSDIVSLSSSSSVSVQFGGSVGRRFEEESTSPMCVVGRIPMETLTEVREVPPEEITKSNWPAKAGYDWVATDVRNQSSLFQWSLKLTGTWCICVGHMAQAGKKNLTLFQALRKEKAVKAKAAGNTRVELPARPDKGKDVKKVRTALLGQGSLSGAKGPEAGLIEFQETAIRKDIAINLPEIVINSIDSMEPDHLVRTMVEFGSKALIWSRRVVVRAPCIEEQVQGSKLGWCKAAGRTGEGKREKGCKLEFPVAVVEKRNHLER
ncbi:hypothetical protein DEO72_LG5g1303 [Vigna unguiculata]|uniref:Uncharacterized protein n=1 Tax=Vigna unguiculata TaxID=3917 RepID=A0A4D6LXZ6_VIGUN|nr:hypothetical protein DEO72_LG5g1303 [Vigna unguiculata]